MRWYNVRLILQISSHLVWCLPTNRPLGNIPYRFMSLLSAVLTFQLQQLSWFIFARHHWVSRFSHLSLTSFVNFFLLHQKALAARVLYLQSTWSCIIWFRIHISIQARQFFPLIWRHFENFWSILLRCWQTRFRTLLCLMINLNRDKYINYQCTPESIYIGDLGHSAIGEKAIYQISMFCENIYWLWSWQQIIHLSKVCTMEFTSSSYLVHFLLGSWKFTPEMNIELCYLWFICFPNRLVWVCVMTTAQNASQASVNMQHVCCSMGNANLTAYHKEFYLLNNGSVVCSAKKVNTRQYTVRNSF